MPLDGTKPVSRNGIMRIPTYILPPKADICGAKRNVRFGPAADSLTALWLLVEALAAAIKKTPATAGAMG